MNFELLVELHQDGNRQGPGSTKETLRALALTGLSENEEIEILDVGCGTGAQTITLAENTRGRITAVDIFPSFLQKLNERARRLGLQNRICTDQQAMEKLPYDDAQFDLIWSEGAIYNMGFAEGLRAWKPLLKKGGYLAVSEICWFTEKRPTSVESYWQREYPQIDTISNKIRVIEEAGYSPVGFFQLPADCWVAEYYLPIEKRMQAFLEKYNYRKDAVDLIDEHKEEIAFFKKYAQYYGYGFYIARTV